MGGVKRGAGNRLVPAGQFSLNGPAPGSGDFLDGRTGNGIEDQPARGAGLGSQGISHHLLHSRIMRKAGKLTFQFGALLVGKRSGPCQLLLQEAGHLIGHLGMTLKKPKSGLTQNLFIGGKVGQQLNSGKGCSGHLVQRDEGSALGVRVFALQSGGGALGVTNLDERVNERMLEHATISLLCGGKQRGHSALVADAPQRRGGLAAKVL